MKQRLMALGLGAALIATSCANDPAPQLPQLQLVSSLQRFDQCEDFLAYVKDAASDQVGPYGLNGYSGYGGVMPMMEGDVSTRSAAPVPPGTIREDASASIGNTPQTSVPASKASDGLAATGGSNAATNNQEANVDEADLIKIDGNRIVTARGNEVIITKLQGGVPVVTGRVAIQDGTAERLFLLGDRAYVLGTAISEAPVEGRGGVTKEIAPVDGYWMPRSMITEISLVGAPAVTDTAVIDGQILDGRMVDGTLRLVLSSTGGTRLGFVMPSDGTEAGQERAESTNRDVLAQSSAEDWLPTVIEGDKRRPLLDCDDAFHPAEFSGLSMLSVLTMADGVKSLTATGLLADSQITYASPERLYVATNRWANQFDPSGAPLPDANEVLEHTDVHAFDIAGTKAAEYLASGRVDGQVLNQYSMSDADGLLRIATTVTTTAPDRAGEATSLPDATTSSCPADAICEEPAIAPDVFVQPTTDSRITVLQVSGESLEPIGSVGGLGPSESIRSVRYVGDLAYVVTFRQTDPFYVVDLSDPTKPRTLGELKVPGFSAYLHPVGERLVLGVGSDADTSGRITGAKVSLYDTTDPVAPREVATWVNRELSFLTDGDPKAFHFDTERNLVFLPYYGSCWSDLCSATGPQNGVVVFKVDPTGITEVGRIDHRDRTPGVPTPDEPTTTISEPATTIAEATTTTEPVTESTTTTSAPETTLAPSTTIADLGTRERQTGAASSSGEPGVSEPALPIECGPAVDCVGPTEPSVPFEYLATISRVFVAGDVVVTLSEAGIATHDVTTLVHRGFATF